MTTIGRRALIAALLLRSAGPAEAHSYRLGPISIGHAWIRPGRTSSEAFVPLALAPSAEPEALIGARSAVAALIRFRRADDPLERIDLVPGRGVAMRPGALHLQVEGLSRPLVADERVPVELAFRRAGRITVDFWVEERPYGGGPPRER